MQKSFLTETKKLYIVSTPIGNLSDMTYRAVEILKAVDLILAEDTRNSKVLLNHYNIDKPLLSYHEFNKEEQASKMIEMLKLGKNIALISDAGTPGINDPGYEIIKGAVKEGIDVIAIPGASAVLTGLISSGLVIQPFTFIGFLPRKKGEATKVLRLYEKRRETLVFYESPLRIKKMVQLLFDVFGNRKIVLGRELTKKFETIYRMTLEEALDYEFDQRGEYVIIIEGASENAQIDLSIDEHVNQYLNIGYPEKDAIKQVAKDRKTTKNDIYQAYKIQR